MTLLRLDIVGLWFKPPASRLIKSLPLNCRLELSPEPMNPVDANAVAVWLPVKDLKLNKLYGSGSPLQHGDGNPVMCQDIWNCFHLSTWLEKVKPGETVQAETYEEFRDLVSFQLGYIPAVEAANLSMTSSIAGQLKWREAENSRRGPKPQVEFRIEDGA